MEFKEVLKAVYESEEFEALMRRIPQCEFDAVRDNFESVLEVVYKFTGQSAYSEGFNEGFMRNKPFNENTKKMTELMEKLTKEFEKEK